jgi:hypothetical protein
VVAGSAVALTLFANLDNSTYETVSGQLNLVGPDAAFSNCSTGAIPGANFNCNSATNIGWFGASATSGVGIPTGNYSVGTFLLTAGLGSAGTEIVLNGSDWSDVNFGYGQFANEGGTLLTIQVIPEPHVAVLLGAGLAGLAFLRRKRA